MQKEMVYLKKHFMASDTQIAREETRYRRYIDYSLRLAVMVLLYAPSHITRPVVEHWLEREMIY